MKFLNAPALALFILTATANSTYSQTTTTTQPADTVKTAQLKVKGITCSMDLKMIAANVEKLKGVSSCKPGKQGTTTTFEVRYNPSAVTEKEVITAIESTGSCENPDERPYKVKQ